jgi:hypothetical protein
MDPETVRVYEARGDEWAAKRSARFADAAVGFAARVAPGATRADLGCGPGLYLPNLGEPVLALDAAATMLDLAGQAAPGALRVRADLESLPLRAASLGGAWARASYLHVARTRLPLALRQLHQACVLDAPVVLSVTRGDAELDELTTDDFAGRRFAQWQPEPFTDVVAGAGFALDDVRVDDEWITVAARRGRLLPDTVAAGQKRLPGRA